MELMKPPRGFRMRPTYMNDADDLKPRAEDVREWEVSGAGKFVPALRRSVDEASWSAAITDVHDGTLHAILGVSHALHTPVPVIWMVASDEMVRRWREAAKPMLEWFNGPFSAAYPYVQCWASEENHKHLDWLEHLGFSRTGHNVVGGEGVLLIHYTRAAG